MSDETDHLAEAADVIDELQTMDKIMTAEEKRGRLSTAINHLKAAKPEVTDEY